MNSIFIRNEYLWCSSRTRGVHNYCRIFWRGIDLILHIFSRLCCKCIDTLNQKFVSMIALHISKLIIFYYILTFVTISRNGITSTWPFEIIEAVSFASFKGSSKNMICLTYGSWNELNSQLYCKFRINVISKVVW